MLKRKGHKNIFLILYVFASFRFPFCLRLLYCFGSSVINVALIVHKNIFYPSLMISATFVIIYGKFLQLYSKVRLCPCSPSSAFLSSECACYRRCRGYESKHIFPQSLSAIVYMFYSMIFLSYPSLLCVYCYGKYQYQTRVSFRDFSFFFLCGIFGSGIFRGRVICAVK